MGLKTSEMAKVESNQGQLKNNNKIYFENLKKSLNV